MMLIGDANVGFWKRAKRFLMNVFVCGGSGKLKKTVTTISYETLLNIDSAMVEEKMAWRDPYTWTVTAPIYRKTRPYNSDRLPLIAQGPCMTRDDDDGTDVLEDCQIIY